MKKYKKDCFAFIKEHPTEGCESLIKCECENCSFYKSIIEHDFDLLQYPIDENYKKEDTDKKE